ncbi:MULTISPECIES: high-potential iron-sulfur protein [unclassified Thioalkalivibrio]|uniref:high-potential iron-sulfur protein n=1 Tax=unclassified Thioalkalivibrio TaxID=2621013 RepID=UPI00037BB166|nr:MULTISPECIES: high-potential iron-sulfur protein [unclassified Thioalkalivibrio]
MSDQPNANRRKFLRQASAAVAAIPVISMAGMSTAKADNPKAEDGHRHDYVNNAADAAGHEDYSEGEKCKNCAFWGSGDAEWGQCFHADFQGVQVNAAGWCDEYVGA